MSNTVAGQPGLDPTLPDVTLILGGVERKLCFDYNAIVLAEKAAGVNLFKAMVSEISATNLRGLLWAALVRDNPTLTLDQVGAMITPRNFNIIHQALSETWFGSAEDPESKDASTGEATAQATKAA